MVDKPLEMDLRKALNAFIIHVTVSFQSRQRPHTDHQLRFSGIALHIQAGILSVHAGV
jgi:hypothetical protein